jgi:flagellar protein FlaG
MEGVGAVKSQEIQRVESLSSSTDPKLKGSREKVPKNERGPSEKQRIAFETVERDTRHKLDRIAQALDTYVRSSQRKLAIQVHPGTGNIMVKVISADDGKVVREIPPEEILDLAAKMKRMTGILFDEDV